MRVVEIFDSIQGEGITVGRPSTFVRLAGCNLRCRWCDTKYAWDPEAGEEMTTDQILTQITRQPNIVITGGEPLLQDLFELLQGIKRGHGWRHITVETNCTIWEPELAFGKYKYYEDYFSYVDLWSISPKLPSSGYEPDMEIVAQFRRMNRKRQQWKFVIANEDDFDYLRQMLDSLPYYLSGPLILQPAGLWQRKLTDFLVEQVVHKGYIPPSNMYGRVHIIPQVHVLLWGQQRRK